jgi:zinc D-Ala-D-Ala carboxypeptidase
MLAYSRRLAAIHLRLGIPASYAFARQLAPHLEAEEPELVAIARRPDGAAILLLRPAAEAWRRLREAAAGDGVTLLPISGFRSVERQAELIAEHLQSGRTLADILRNVAAPGFSEHHSGRALDIGSPEHGALDEDFARTSAFRWLERHALRFDFRLSFPPHNRHGIAYEPWHWCWSAAEPNQPRVLPAGIPALRRGRSDFFSE